MAFVSEITAQLKGDNADFRSKMAEAGEAVEGFDKKVKKFGLGFGGVAALAGAFREIVDHARNLEGPLDANQQRAKDFAAGLDAAKKSALDVGVAVLGTVNSFGEWIGKQASILKYGEQQVALAEQIDKQTKETLLDIEQDKKRTEEIAALRKQIAEVQKRANEEAFKQLSVDEQILQTNIKIQAAKDAIAQAGEDRVERAKAELVLEQERATMVKLVGEQNKANAQEEKKIAEEKQKAAEKDADAEAERIRKIAAEKVAAEKQLAAARAAAAKERALENADANLTLDEQVKKLREQGKSTEEIIAITGRRGWSEEAVRKVLQEQTNEVEKQIFKVSILSKGRGDSDLSDRVLEDKIGNLQKQIAQIEFENFTSPLAYRNPLLAPLQKELAFAQDELYDRRRIRAQVAQFGETGAAQFYRGEMDNFERLLKFVQDQPDVKRTADVLESIEQRLGASGIFPKR